MNGEEKVINYSTERVDDGYQHVAIIKRDGNEGSIELDHYTIRDSSRPTTQKEAFMSGHVFIGGAPNLNNFTGDRYTQGFNGCVHSIEPLESGQIDIHKNTISSLNISKCQK